MKIFDSHIHLDAFTGTLGCLPHNTEHHAFVPAIAPNQTMAFMDTAPDARVRIGAALHPWHLPPDGLPPERHPELCDAVRALAQRTRVCAVGETGLDHYRFEDAHRENVERWFRWHVSLAREVDKPLVVHCVRAHGDCLRVLRALAPPRGGVIHAFSGSPEVAAEYARIGFMVGIGSAVTRDRSRRVQHAAAQVPLANLLIETDAPFIGAHDRGSGEGRVGDILDVCARVAALRGISVEHVAAATFENAARLFGEPLP